jgi:phosphate transport system substrate-binding protein
VRRRLTILASAACLLALIPVSAAQASGPTITGAGSTWVSIALDQWRADAARLGLSVNYQAVGSTAGRQFYIMNQVDFAASEIPFLPSEVAQLRGEHKSYQYLPDVAGGTALMYNVRDTSGHQVKTLQLSASTIAGIFTGKITNWDDPAIRRDNPGLHLPNEKLTPVIRSDGSGTSAKLADYLDHEAHSQWAPFAAQYNVTLPVQFWPNFPGSVAVRLSDGVANFISNASTGQGSIGYVEAGYVYEHSFTPAYIRNRSGHYAAPSAVNVETALKHVTLNRDLTQNLAGAYSAPEANAYPLASYSYLITQTKGFNPAKGAVLGKWIIYIACAGQKEAVSLGYAPLTPNLVRDVFSAVRRIPGAPRPPALTASACPNPTITGASINHGPGSSGGTRSGSGTGTTTTTGSGTGQTTTTHHSSHHHHHGSSSTKQATTPTQSAGGPATTGATAINVALLSASERAQAHRAGAALIAAARAPSQTELWVIGAIVALAALAPLGVLSRRRRIEEAAR